MKTIRKSLVLSLIITMVQVSSTLAFSLGDPPIKVRARPSALPFSSDYVFELENTSSDALEKVKVYINSAPLAKTGGEMMEIARIGPKATGGFTMSKKTLEKYFIRAPGKAKPAVSVHVEAKGYLGELHLLFQLDYK